MEGDFPDFAMHHRGHQLPREGELSDFAIQIPPSTPNIEEPLFAASLRGNGLRRSAEQWRRSLPAWQWTLTLGRAVATTTPAAVLEAVLAVLEVASHRWARLAVLEALRIVGHGWQFWKLLRIVGRLLLGPSGWCEVAWAELSVGFCSAQAVGVRSLGPSCRMICGLWSCDHELSLSCMARLCQTGDRCKKILGSQANRRHQDKPLLVKLVVSLVPEV